MADVPVPGVYNYFAEDKISDMTPLQRRLHDEHVEKSHDEFMEGMKPNPCPESNRIRHKPTIRS